MIRPNPMKDLKKLKTIKRIWSVPLNSPTWPTPLKTQISFQLRHPFPVLDVRPTSGRLDGDFALRLRGNGPDLQGLVEALRFRMEAPVKPSLTTRPLNQPPGQQRVELGLFWPWGNWDWEKIELTWVNYGITMHNHGKMGSYIYNYNYDYFGWGWFRIFTMALFV